LADKPKVAGRNPSSPSCTLGSDDPIGVASKSLSSKERTRARGGKVSRLVELDLNEGGSILVEVDEPSRGPVTRGARPEEVVTRAGQSLEQVLGRLGPAVKGIVAELRRTADWPDDVEVEFAVKLSADSNVIIARAGGEANFRISLRWSKPGPDA